MFEKFSYSRKTTPFNKNTKISEAEEGTSRQERFKKGRRLHLDEVVVAVMESPVGSPAAVDSNDCDSTDDEDLLKPALKTDTEENEDEKRLNKTHVDSKAALNDRNSSKIVHKTYKESIHDDNFLKLHLEEIFPNEKEEIKRKAVELSSSLEDAVDTVLALKASEENADNNDSLIIRESGKSKTRRKRVLSFNDSDSDVCPTPSKKNKYTSVVKCPNMANNITHKKELQSKISKDNNEVIEISDSEGNQINDDGGDNSDDDGFEDDDEATILSFLNDSTKEELNSIPGFSSSKSNKLIRLRPFESWKDLKSKIEAAKGISVQIIWDCHLLLEKRLHVIKLMKKCERIARNIQKMLSDQTSGIENSNTGVSQPGIINKSCKLKPYQLTGLNWLILMHKQNMNGILADEMGLGKTIQAISFIAHLIEQGDDGPYLIVAPASTVDNWMKELEHWCPTVNYVQYYGSAQERFHLREEILSPDFECQVIITTYQIVASNPQDRSLFRKLDTHYVVFDEGHMLKNMKSQRYQKLFNLRARRRLLLTGTPLQNNLLELMSLLSFVMPHMFDESSEGLRMLFSDKRNEESSVTYEKEILEQAKRIMKPFVLRRLKRDVLQQLPQKHEEIIMCDLTDQQRILYDKVFLECYQKYQQSGVLSQNGKNTNLMMPLRMTSNHPLLLRNYYTNEKLREMATQYCRDLAHRDCDPDLVYEDMTVMSDFEIDRLCKQEYKLIPHILDQEILLDSGKFNALDSVLPTMKEQGDRVLLFSQFTLVMDVIEVYLKRKNFSFLRLDGSTKVADRQNLIDKFNSEPDIFIFLLSTRAGGLGINLTSANVVILNDIDFNPYNDKQAEDRCHRVGQTRDVRVYKLISRNTIEEAMLKCAKSKLKLEKDVVSTDDDEEDIAFILGQTFTNAESS
ncbi:SWI/SNF-related matrix-associated actin-dependent regulator of chromatin subfamily A containing DEAD/H box 1-like [Actinia tenebrosa]|uniref:DNA helicase n=1 Tax=Actinia tenebrosa TaxID=6105 RepID=A0A6P8ILY5_ACTTE|nr:SWI/SNF-related matrix-associated actin-dependent regulator of chromatin subfamily A containing DEAD/H box 1-like [Actinia tenebrosa]